jgi:DNA-binding response OmpR family regulator
MASTMRMSRRSEMITKPFDLDNLSQRIREMMSN